MSAWLRVLVVTNLYPTDESPGDTPAIRDQILSLRAHGIEIDLLHINRSKGWRAYGQAAWQMFQKNFESQKYDLVHAYYGHSGLIAEFQFRCPVVVTFLGSDLLTRRDGRIGKLAARRAAAVIVMTEEMKAVTGRTDAHIIPHGVNTSIFKPYPKELARRELGLPLDEKLILFPWNPARPVKRFDIVEKVVDVLQQRQKEVRLVVVFDKSHETAARYMNACDAMILVSDHEGAPMAVREALACNLPIVSVDVGDVRSVIAEVEGCHVCRREVADLVDKLDSVLSRGMRVDGAQVIDKLDVDWAARQIISVYKAVHERRSTGNRQ